MYGAGQCFSQNPDRCLKMSLESQHNISSISFTKVSETFYFKTTKGLSEILQNVVSSGMVTGLISNLNDIPFEAFWYLYSVLPEEVNIGLDLLINENAIAFENETSRLKSVSAKIIRTFIPFVIRLRLSHTSLSFCIRIYYSSSYLGN